ncbi:branched-chain amino acid ABC transporter ATP-binding protein/permease [Variovorax sp. ZT5P49]|uniref:branched-chain amino acid ABC transporter ATP-binding protein/permease n=1 Tax=Variovorax sp. ZT5P49 TaxID=3443733 RepID=UPI003F47CFA1
MKREQSFIAALTAIILVLLATTSTYYVGLIAVAGINSIVCLGLAFLLATGQLSLGHAAFLGLGAYGAALLTTKAGLPPLAAIPAAVAVCALIGYGLGKLTLHLKGHYLPLATLAYGMAISVCFVAAIDITGGASGLDNVPAMRVGGLHLETRAMALLIWVVVALVLFCFLRIYRGRIGRVARALKSNSTMAAAFGVDVASIKTQIFVLSAALAGLAGSMYAYYMQFLSPSSFSIGTSFNLLIMVVLGGVAHPLGPILGVIFFTLLELTAQYLIATQLGIPGQLETMVFGAVLIVTLLRWPDGLLTWIKLRSDVKVPSSGNAPFASHRSRRSALTVQGLTKKFGGLTALSDVSIAIPPAQITGLIGPNGAGKSTLFNLMTGMFPATHGDVTLDGAPLRLGIDQVVGSGIARTFQHVQLVQELDVLQNVLIGGYNGGRSGILTAALGRDRAEETRLIGEALVVIRRVGLVGAETTPVGSLPLGSQRLVEVARALMAKPDILLLDEPAAGLRAPEKAHLSKLLQSLRDDNGMTVLIVEHDMELVMGCADHIFVLNYGALLASGTPECVQQDPAVINAYLGVAS